MKCILLTLLFNSLSCHKEQGVKNEFESHNNGKYELRIELAKEYYKEFEPVLVKFTLINHDTLPLILNNRFSTESTTGAFLVFKDKENKEHYLRSNYRSLLVITTLDIGPEDTVAQHVIYPKDTFYVSMPVNNWGDKVEFNSFKDNKILFNNFGYFRNGNYKFYYMYPEKRYDDISDKKSHVMESNELFLRIKENTLEDLHLLKLLNDRTFQSSKGYAELIVKFPESIYREHLLKKYISSKRNEAEDDFMINEYEKFISEFPGSYYLLEDMFINYYIYLLIKGFNNVDKAICYLNEKISNPLLLNYVSNRKRIYNIVTHKWH